jgi:hypothetical protein
VARRRLPVAAICLPALCGPALLAPARAAAQGGARTQVLCNGQIVTDIIIKPQPPSLGGIFRRIPALANTVRALHTTTDPEVVRRFVLLEKGRPCSKLRRGETERVLRAQPFLAEASVTAYPDPAGSGVQIEVVTVDEVSTIASVGVSGSSPFFTALRLGSSNVSGQGLYAMGEWREGDFYRDAWNAKVTDYQVMGRPYQLSVAGARRHYGGAWVTELTNPFFSDVQRGAWRATAGGQHSYSAFSRPDAPSPAVSVRRSFVDVGGIFRVGEAGRLSLFGASFTRETDDPAFEPVRITDRGIIPDTSGALVGRYARRRAARVNLLWGVRNIEFARVRGFDALTSEQDVRTGFQLGTLFGRSLAVLGSTDDDMFVGADAYAGMGSQWSFVAAEVRGEGRQSYDTNRWDDILGSGRAAWYFKIEDRHTAITSAEWSGGWRQRTPFQLTLGEYHGGMRGFRSSRLPGGQRAILRHEQRWVLGDVSGAADAGLALFAEAGRIWQGDVPYGVSTPVRYAVGASLLAAVPPRSQRLWRLDIAVPLSNDAGTRVEFRLSQGKRTRTFWDEPDDMVRSRARTVPTSIFSWP